MTQKASYLPRSQRFLNKLFIRFVRLGIIPGGHLISVPGRKSGVMHITPLFVLQYEGDRWMVSGFEQADWVKNLRAAGWCLLIHDRQEERVTVTEVTDPAICAPLLQTYLKRAPGGGRGFAIKPDAPLAEFAAIVPQHPVFRVEKGSTAETG